MRAAPVLRVLGALFSVLAGLPAAPAVAQEEPPVFQDEVSVGLVLVPVVVRGGEGYAKDLDQEDFRLLVEGKPVAIESFEKRSDAPASVVVLQDLSGSMATGGKLEASREVVRFFLDKALTGDEFSLAFFAGDQLQVEVPFTTDRAVLREASDRWEAYGTTALHDAVAHVPQISLEGRNPKRFAVLITDGVDNASHLTPDQARFVVQQAQLPTYVLGMRSGDPYEVSPEGKRIYRYADVLNMLALGTGGRYYSISGPQDLQAALTAILDDVRHQYVLGFDTGDGAVKFRTLKVEVKDKGKNVRTIVFRRGYKGTPPANSRTGG